MDCLGLMVLTCISLQDTTAFQGWTTSQFHSVDEKLDRISSRLEELGHDRDMLHATTVEIQNSIGEIRSNVKLLRASSAGFLNGYLTWPIPDVGQKVRDTLAGKTQAMFSVPFYTRADGYKMCLCVYLDGNGPGHKTHISIFFIIMRGEYDELLEWPFNYKVSITLFNQENQADSITRSFESTTAEHFQRPLTAVNVGTGYPKFATIVVLRDPRYVKDDKMFIKAMVEKSSHALV